MAGAEREKWKDAMAEELARIKKMETYELVDAPLVLFDGYDVRDGVTEVSRPAWCACGVPSVQCPQVVDRAAPSA